MTKLGVNIDHVATVREARKTNEPDPVWAAAAAQLGGADGITVHLREDRRHIQDRDVRILKQTVTAKLNLECACVDEMVGIACDVRPTQVCLVPERRQEVTTEGGLDVAGNFAQVERVVERLRSSGIEVSLFIDPLERQIEAAQRLKVDAVEIHTGQYALSWGKPSRSEELHRLAGAAQLAKASGLHVHAGHGLTYDNVHEVAALPEIEEFNIGHSIVSRSILVGMSAAVAEMKRLLQVARGSRDSNH